MKKFTLLVLLVIFAFTLLGCAGGGSGAGAGGDSLNNRGSGSLSLKINWPSGSKASVLSSAYSIKLNVCTQSTTSTGTTQYTREVNALVITHTSTNTTENKTINGIPIGPRVVIAQAYNSSGAEIGYGTASVTIASGDNSGVTITLSSGTFPYTINGMADVSAPTSSSGGGGTTTTYHYLFVNNYQGGTISVIKQETNAVVGTITVPDADAYLTKGAFNFDGTAYYVVNSMPGASCIYKVTITNTSDWSANAVTTLYNFGEGLTAREILYEKTSAGNEYLWVGLQYMAGFSQAYIKRIKLSDLSYIIGADSGMEYTPYNYEIIGFCDPTVPNSDGKVIAIFSKGSDLLATACYYDSASGGRIMPENLMTNSVVVGRSAGFGPEASIKTTGGLMPSYTVYIPTLGEGLYTALFDNSTNRLTASTIYNNFFASGFKLLLPSSTYYGLNNGTLKYATDLATAPEGWTSLMEVGIAAKTFAGSFSDMAVSSDGSYMYVTNFGLRIYPDSNYGNTVYVKTLSNTTSTSANYTITVGKNPFSIVLKP